MLIMFITFKKFQIHFFSIKKKKSPFWNTNKKYRSLKEAAVSLQGCSCPHSFAVQGLGMQPLKSAWPGSGSSAVTASNVTLDKLLNFSVVISSSLTEDNIPLPTPRGSCAVKHGKSCHSVCLALEMDSVRCYFYYLCTFRLWTSSELFFNKCF